ncbi:MAG TPA: GEVED domain-containing protein [Panacibacter sp.]|nr:GEVED domain-containing protein [Panacibacter sp.]
MKKFLQSTAAVLISFCSFAQSYSVDWLRTADNYLKSGTMLARDNADNVVVAGQAVTSSIYTQKYDKFGNLQWERSSSSGIQSNYEAASWVNTDAQNNVYVTGYRYSYSTQPPYNFPNAIIVLKYDATGNLQWKFILEGSYGITIPYSYSALRFRSELDANGNLYVGTSGNITGNPTQGFVLVKLNPQGNMVWNRTSTAGSAGGFLSMRLKNDRVVLTGSSAPYFGNVATAMFDTSGNEKWRATTTERGGQDVELDDLGNAYILTGNYNEVSPTSGLDIVLMQYNTNGAQTARYKYNFADNEVGYRLCRTGTNELGISGYGYFGGGFTSDWLVMKVNMSNGALQWSKTDVNSSPYDVAANTLIGNSKGELFVTGYKPSGKPFPGYLAMATRKYQPDGTISWTALYDSTASRGTALSQASNGSIYVLGSSYATVLHYFDHTGTGTCGITDTARVSNITKTSAVIEYPKNANAIIYHIQYKASTSPLWITVSTDKPKYKITGLMPGITYDYRIENVCNSGPSGYKATRHFTTAGTPYCATGALNATNDYIAYVQFGGYVDGINNSTGSNNGYADFTYISATVAPGSKVTGYLSASYFAPVFNEFFRVWIDFNMDGDFNDVGEKVIDTTANGIGSFAVSFTVPANAKLGNTRMRVAMKNGSAPPACGSYASGETEDYGITIVNPIALQAIAFTNAENMQKLPGVFAIAPNPASNQVTIQHDFNNTKPVYITVFNTNGQQVISKVFTGNKLDVSKLPNGLYIVQLMQGNVIKRTKLLVQR